MKPFRFRAAAALELRRRQEDEARKAFAQAEAAERSASARVREAERRVEDEREKFREVLHAPVTAWLISWHQSWMTKQRLDLQARRRDLAVASTESATRGLALRAAFRRRRALERLQERALRKYRLEAERRETHEMNLLAGLRFVAQAAEAEGAAREHEQHR